MNEHFPPSLRVRKRREYLDLHRGRRVATAHFVFFVRERGDQAPPRLGLIVSRKVGNAIVRNLLKRRCRELFRRRFVRELRDGLDFVVLAKPTAGSLDFAALTQEWERAVQRVPR